MKIHMRTAGAVICMAGFLALNAGQPAQAATAPAAAAVAAAPAPAMAPVAAATTTAAAPLPADYAQRVEAAKAYLKTLSARQMVDQMMDELAKNPQVHMNTADFNDIKANIDFDALDKTMLDAMAHTFTVDELKGLAQFYGSPTGQAIMKKMPVYMAQVMPYVQQTVVKAVMTHMQKMQAAQPHAAPAPGAMSAPAAH